MSAFRKCGAILRKGSVLSKEQDGQLTMLEDMSALWLRPEAFQSNYGRQQKTKPAFECVTNKCSACILAQIGGNTKLVTALGGFFIGRVDTSIWRRGKRVMWMGSWIRNSIDDSQEEEAIQKMWQLGVHLRELRKKGVPQNRAYIDEYVKMSKSAEGSEPGRTPATSHPTEYAELANEAPYGSMNPRVGEWLSEVTADDLFDRPNEPLAPIPEHEKPTQWDPVDYNFEPAPGMQARTPQTNLRPPSSVYSRNTAVTAWPPASPYDTVSDLIDHYRHSNVSTPTPKPLRVAKGSPESAPRRQLPNDPELAKYPRHRFSPVTLPRSSDS